MQNKWQEYAAWSGPLCALCFGMGLGPLTSNMLPPPAPGLSAVDIAEMYRTNLSGIRVGVILELLAGGFLVVFAGAISAQMRKMEDVPPVLTYVQLVTGALASIPFLAGSITMGLAAFRPERSPETILLLNDLTWIFFVMPAANAIFQLLAIGFVILGDESPEPAFGRWIGYLNIWVAISFLPPLLLLFFKNGPFAWNGLLSFWLGAATFTTWVVVMTRALVKAARRNGAAIPIK